MNAIIKPYRVARGWSGGNRWELVIDGQPQDGRLFGGRRFPTRTLIEAKEIGLRECGIEAWIGPDSAGWYRPL